MGLKKIFSGEAAQLSKLSKTADSIISLENSMSNLKDDDFNQMTNVFREKLTNGFTMDDILIEAYALVREAAKRKLGLNAYKVQLMGAISLHNGDIAEMKTGEGKTLTGIFPAYLNALDGKGVMVITVNDYLSQRDMMLNKPVFDLLGITTGYSNHEMTPAQKRAAYLCDITYVTGVELTYDYMRDNMAKSIDSVVLRGFNYAIIDEVDSLLIDSARMPIIISENGKIDEELYLLPDKLVKSLSKDKDYKIDYEEFQIFLTDDGARKAESFFHIENLMAPENSYLHHRILQALRANYMLVKDKDYLVDEQTDNISHIFVIDKYTGRVEKDQRYSAGLHQAVEAKEGQRFSPETIVRASVTYQNFFRMFHKLCGMTGTAKTEEDEFLHTYNMRVIEIPAHKKMNRVDDIDLIYSSTDSKYKAIVNDVKARHEKGQPVILGTIAVETSEVLSGMLDDANVPHNVLNAKNHTKEAEIILNAGQKGAVTIATNMAGRGADIKLGEGVRELGGLAIIGSERHEARRIDNQLRGRSGRQGDPGHTQFYIALDDELMKRFGGPQIATFMNNTLGDDKPIKSKILSKLVENSQKKSESINFDNRAETLKYDNIDATHRKIFYEDRRKVFTADTADAMHSLLESINATHDVIDEFCEKAQDDETRIVDTVKTALLKAMDDEWTNHLTTMKELNRGIGLQAYAKISPYDAYSEAAFALFERMQKKMAEDMLNGVKLALHSVDFEVEDNVTA